MRIDFSFTRRKALVALAGLALVAVAGLAAAAAHAAEEQRRGGRGAWMGGPRGGGPAGALLPPLRRLDLSDEQREQVRAVVAESREAARTGFQELVAAREALAEAVAAATVDEDRIRTLAADLGRIEGDVAVRRAHVRAAVWRILTPEQQQRAEEIRARQEERREARRERMQERRERMQERRDQRSP